MTVRILEGDVRDVLRSMDGESVDCVVTSPPYWGLRDYGVPGQIGMEPSLGEHLAVLVAVFAEVRRVMKARASLWLNYGDCYATNPAGRSAAQYKADGKDDRTFRDKPFSTVGPVHPPNGDDPFRRDKSRRGGGLNSSPGLKPKDLCMVSNRLAIALQEDGWWVRSEIVWGKNNPMPDSSGKYRPSAAHEKIWLLTKSAKSYYDAEAVAIPCSDNTHARIAGYKMPDNWDTGAGAHGTFHRKGREKGKKQDGHGRRYDGFNERYFSKRKLAEPGSGTKNNSSMDAALAIMPETRYLRNYEAAPLEVWAMSTQPFSEAHFATFPPELVRRAILAGCPEGGTVLDPFGGAGTTGMVADRLGRDAILIELNPEYAAIARSRIRSDGGMFVEVRP
jgi:DNA modification methylase